MGHRADNTSKGNRWNKISTLSFHTSHVFRLLSIFAVSFSIYLFAIRVYSVLTTPVYSCCSTDFFLFLFFHLFFVC